MSFIEFILYLLFSIPTAFVAFVITVKLVTWAKNTRFEKLIDYTVKYPFIILDWYVNWTTAFIIFIDPPRSLGELVTARIKRYRKKYLGKTNLKLIERWRLAFSEKLGSMLNRQHKGHYK